MEKSINIAEIAPGLYSIIKSGSTAKNRKVIRDKGQSLLEFPSDYTLIDIETTGLDPRYDRIIEMSALKVRQNEVVGKFNYLVKYPDDNSVPFEITNITGISEDMILNDGVIMDDILKKYVDFIDKDLIVGFNVNFDINFIYDLSIEKINHKFKNDFVDVMRIARKYYPQERHNRLRDCIERIGIKREQAHRGLRDCIDTKEVLDYFNENSSLDIFEKSKAIQKQHSINLSKLKPEYALVDSSNPFFQTYVCFTGKLDSLVRREAAQLVTNLGAIAQNGVTKKTNFLILGDTAYSLHGKVTTTTKLIKAKKIIAAGENLQIISETVFIDMLKDCMKERDVG